MSKKLTTIMADIVRDAGGEVVGRTKLQKLTYLLVASGLEDDLPFVYKHYGPYCEAAAVATREAGLLGLLREREDSTSWGGFYSTYSVTGVEAVGVSPARLTMAAIANAADAVELELAATALFLSKEGCVTPWVETERRKPEKANNGRLERAKVLYQRFVEVESPSPLPKIN